MNRAFLSLYAVIVLSVILVGWGADKLWQHMNPEPVNTPFETSFFSFLSSELKNKNADEAALVIQQLPIDKSLELSIYTLEELAHSQFSARIKQGDIATVYNEQGQASHYYRINNSDIIVRVTELAAHSESSNIYIALLVAFYLTIAVVVYIWVWPLSRDLKNLQQHTQQVGLEGGEQFVELNPSSTVFPLAAAFNRMSMRIQQLLASHKEITYAVSHELRTPLARMKFSLVMAEQAAEDPNTDKQLLNKQLKSIADDVTEMDNLVRELLAYASFEQKQEQLKREKGDVVALVRGVVDAHRQLPEARDLQVEIKASKEPFVTYCEWYLFERCIHNLIQNAFKYAEQRVLINVFENENQCVISIEDDGPGISEADAGKVFDAFVRLRKDEEDNPSGFGLGLAIVRRIIHWHNGKVSVSKGALGGARFDLSWPLN